MGTWGTELYSNDYTADIKDAFDKQMLRGKKPKEIFAQLYEELKPEVDEEEGYLFWLAVADRQTRYGCQENDVVARALAILETDADNRAWLEATPKERVARKQEMTRLRERILHPPTTPQKPHITKALKSPWTVGTLLSIKLVNSGYPLKGASYETYWGQYALLLVTDIYKEPHRYLDDEFDEFPVVCVHYEVGGETQLPPITSQAFMPLDFWPTMSGNKSAHFIACDKLTPKQKRLFEIQAVGVFDEIPAEIQKLSQGKASYLPVLWDELAFKIVMSRGFSDFDWVYETVEGFPNPLLKSVVKSDQSIPGRIQR